MYIRVPGPELTSFARPCQRVPSCQSHCGTHTHTCTLQGVSSPWPALSNALTLREACAYRRTRMLIEAGACTHTYQSTHTHKQSHTIITSIHRETLFAQIPSLASKYTLYSVPQIHSWTLTVTRRLLRQYFCLAFPESGCCRSLEWILEYQVTGLQSSLCHGAPGATHSHYVPEPHLLDPTGLDHVTELSWLPGPRLLLCKS